LHTDDAGIVPGDRTMARRGLEHVVAMRLHKPPEYT
jgi:hypothetical protein